MFALEIGTKPFKVLLVRMMEELELPAGNFFKITERSWGTHWS